MVGGPRFRCFCTSTLGLVDLCGTCCQSVSRIDSWIHLISICSSCTDTMRRTHNCGHNLDLVYPTGSNSHISKTADFISDHRYIMFASQSTAMLSSTLSVLNQWGPSSSHIDDMFNHFNNICASALEIAAPVKTKSSRWINNDISNNVENPTAACPWIVHFNNLITTIPQSVSLTLCL